METALAEIGFAPFAIPAQLISPLHAAVLFRPPRFIGFFDPHGRRWIRHQNFALAAPGISFTQPFGDDANVGSAGIEYAVIILRFLVHRLFSDRVRDAAGSRILTLSLLSKQVEVTRIKTSKILFFLSSDNVTIVQVRSNDHPQCGHQKTA